MKSIRSFLLSRLLGGTALVLAVAGTAVGFFVTRSLEEQFDQNLTDRVQGLASLLFQVEEDVEFEFSDQLMPEYQREERPDYFELWYRDGRLLERSPSLGRADLLVAGTATDQPSSWTAALPDGRRGRFVAQLIEVHHVFPEEGPNRPAAATFLIVVARGHEELAAAERRVFFGCAGVCLALIGLIALIAFTAVRRGLGPANRLAATLDAIEVDHLPESLELAELPSELEPVAKKTDSLIRRVDAALQRERRTSADIAHELRTPISELLTVSEVALRNGLDSEASRRALRTVRDVAWRMGRSLATLLKLARLEMGTETFRRESVDLGGIVQELLRSLSGVERERGIRVENRVDAGSRVEGDPDVLRIVVSNLLSNALFYSPSHGTVQCRLERSTGERWRFLVENDAADLKPEDLPMLSDPFWRKDGSRSDRDHSGLGLALSCALAEKTGLEILFTLKDQRFQAIVADRSPPDALEEDAAGSGVRDPVADRP